MNCITWYESYAFCIWDSGFLPSEAEWNYAAAHGKDQRAYPWSSPASSQAIDTSYAVYNSAPLATVGSKSSKGDGYWGQADLAGSVWEWDLDWYSSYVPSCNNCAQLTPASYRMILGGGYYSDAANLLSSLRYSDVPTRRDPTIGARCARTP
jgi:formylglycine-generating enzyme required for sulfatase activity